MKRILLGLLALVSLQTTLAQIPTTGLVGYYKFENNGNDASKQNNTALVKGCNYVSDRFNKQNAAIALNGKSDSIIVNINQFKPIKGDFTISFWMKVNLPFKANVFSIKDSPNDSTKNFEVQINSDNIIDNRNFSLFTYWNGIGKGQGNNLSLGYPGMFNDNKWSHYVITRKNDTIQFWFNGLFKVEAYNASDLGDALSMVIGAAPFKFKGSLDDIAFYNVALQEKEIKNLFFDNKSFVFTSPKNTDAFVVNDTAHVAWTYNEGAVSDSVELHYRINQSGVWKLTKHDQNVWSNLSFPLNGYSVGTKIEMRVRDKADTSKYEIVGPFTISEYQWELVTNQLSSIESKGYKFTPRDGCGLLNFQNKLWLIGGWDPPHHTDPNNVHNEIWNSTDGVNWTFVDTADWSGRHISGWLVYDSSIWVIGADPQNGGISDVWKSKDGLNWTKIADNIPNYQSRTMHMVAKLGDYILNFGGLSGGDEDLNEVWRTKNGKDWERLADAPWPGRGMVLNSCVQNDTTLWLLGGGSLSRYMDFNDVWKTNDGINWKLVNEGAPWHVRHWQTVAWHDNKMWVINGYTDTDDNDVWYSQDGIKWFELKNSPYKGRHAHSTTVFGNTIWMGFGINSHDLWRLKNANKVASIDENLEFSTEKLAVFPNPSSESINVSGINKSTSYYIVDVNGKVYQVGETNGNINIASISAGIYLLYVNDQIIKFQKQ